MQNSSFHLNIVKPIINEWVMHKNKSAIYKMPSMTRTTAPTMTSIRAELFDVESLQSRFEALDAALKGLRETAACEPHARKTIWHQMIVKQNMHSLHVCATTPKVTR
jgi:hypothetical protein